MNELQIHRLRQAVQPWARALHPTNEDLLTLLPENRLTFLRLVRRPELSSNGKELLQRACSWHNYQCRPWIKKHCTWCGHKSWRVVRLGDEGSHWDCPRCQIRILNLGVAELWERVFDFPIQHHLDPSFSHVDSFEAEIRLFELIQDKGQRVALDIIIVLLRWWLEEQNRKAVNITSIACGTEIFIPRSWSVLDSDWEQQKQRWAVRKKQGHCYR